ncbi:MAG: substrate-binding domain-containing protein [Pelomonas sp.]|nr:substrate-binding domain-containing protein [Roseateles sp.]
MEAIAERAGVSKITVSRALRNSPLVTPETSARIKAIADQLGYRFNHSARNLRLRRTHIIAVVLEMQPDVDRPIGDPFPLQLLGGVMQELTVRGYSMLLTTMESLNKGQGIAADGMILLGQGEDGQAQRVLEALNLPVAVWGAGAADAAGETMVVGSDNLHGGACVAERFLQLQRQRVWFLGDPHHAEVAERHKGLEQRLRRAKVPVLTLSPAAFTFGAGFTAVQAQLARDAGRPDALLAASDLLAMGAVRALSDAGLSVPEDVTVVGYDDSPAGQTFVPALSSVRQDWRQGGVLLARKVLDRLAGRATHSEILPTSLVLRDT